MIQRKWDSGWRKQFVYGHIKFPECEVAESSTDTRGDGAWKGMVTNES